jgi:hypothetical protein
LTVTSPNGGETYGNGTTQTITWISEGEVGDDVKIEVVHPQGSFTIIESTPNTGSYSNEIPPDTQAASGLKIRITSVSNPAIYDESDGTFSIEIIYT